jgi:hypothetical protein
MREGNAGVRVSVGDDSALNRWGPSIAVAPLCPRAFWGSLGLGEDRPDKVTDVLEAKVPPLQPKVQEGGFDFFNV